MRKDGVMKGAEGGRENQEAFPWGFGLGRTLSVDVMRQGQKKSFTFSACNLLTIIIIAIVLSVVVIVFKSST